MRAVRTMCIRLVAVVALAAVVPVAAGEDPRSSELSSASTQLRSLLARYEAWVQSSGNPEIDSASDDDRRAHYFQSYRDHERKLAELPALVEAAYDVDIFELTGAEQDTAVLLRRALEQWQIAREYKTYLMPLDGVSEPYLYMFDMHRQFDYGPPGAFEQYITRLNECAPYLESQIELMRHGLEEGIVPPKVLITEQPERLELLRAVALDRMELPLLWAQRHVPVVAERGYVQQFREEIRPAIETAIDRYKTFIVEDYLPNLREEIAITALPRGAEFYRREVRLATTTDHTPQELHFAARTRVHKLRDQILRRLQDRIRSGEIAGFEQGMPEGALWSELVTRMRDDESFYTTDTDMILMEYRALCNEALGFLPRYFQSLPETPCGIYPEDEELSLYGYGGHYRKGSIKDGYTSIAFVDLYRTELHPTWYRKPFIFHEAIPGHHLEQMFTVENDDLTELQRQVFVGVHSEGWAMYAEYLASEIGLYQDGWEELGAAFSRMLRVCRVVIDTGIHSQDWTAEQAESYLRESLPFSNASIDSEVRRAIGWPAHGLSYITGMDALLEARQRAEAALGDDFDIRAFHHVVLGHGPLTVPMLNRRIDAWIEAQKLNADN